MSEKLEPMGGKLGEAFDDGVFDGVRKIFVGEDKDNECVSYIKIEYEKDGKFETREHGTLRGELKQYAVEYPNEYIISVGGSYDDVSSYDTVVIKSLIFRSSWGKTSPILGATNFFGYLTGKEFRIEGKTGGKLLGLHGRFDKALNAIGPYFNAVDPSLKQFNLKGGDGGGSWDDGAYDGVRKILVGVGDDYVSYVSFEYAKGEGTMTHDHGTRKDTPKEFVVDYPNEHVTLVEGTTDRYLTSLLFKTSKGRTSPAFGKVAGSKFAFEEKDFKLVGFRGNSGKYVDGLGAYFGPIPAPTPSFTKMGPLGGSKGNTFDDGVFDGVKKVTVGADEYSVTYIKIEYEKDGKVETREHGTARGELKEFSVDYPNENITAVGGSSDHIFTYDTTLISSLYFTLSNGRNSPKFGETSGTDFTFKGENGAKLIGFHGRGGNAIDAIGAYFGAGSG
ncbi:unnamed protein product [Microthlaspi erraticum]|uniref:Jacalin-type lectin domain-containing protein n=1 Tax=Microthlaspi erraticum TaxID=1685480 RepID=A0A6D2JJD8_9BRAS|nr:unnamed protein product [Microthlaspi erraticum]